MENVYLFFDDSTKVESDKVIIIFSSALNMSYIFIIRLLIFQHNTISSN